VAVALVCAPSQTRFVPAGGTTAVTVNVTTPPQGSLLSEVVATPADLTSAGIVWAVEIDDPDRCASALEGVTRGAAVVVRIGDAVDGPSAARFVDELHRAAAHSGPHRTGTPTSDLSTDQRQPLEALGRGVTVAAAAASLGISTRTATRLLTSARQTLGVSTTIEAVVLVNGAGASHGRTRRRAP
jgi:predicted DNA-binding protein (UPF0251 family)